MNERKVNHSVAPSNADFTKGIWLTETVREVQEQLQQTSVKIHLVCPFLLRSKIVDCLERNQNYSGHGPCIQSSLQSDSYREQLEEEKFLSHFFVSLVSLLDTFDIKWQMKDFPFDVVVWCKTWSICRVYRRVFFLLSDLKLFWSMSKSFNIFLLE